MATHLSILAADLLAFWAAFIAAVLIRHAFGGQFDSLDYWRFLPMLLSFIVVYAATGLYPGIGIHPVRELRGIVYSNSVVYLLMMAGTFLSRTGFLYSRVAFSMAWILSIALVLMSRKLVRTLLCRKPWWGVPVVVFGAGAAGGQLVDLLRTEPGLGLKVAAILDDDPATHNREVAGNRPPVLGSLSLAPLLADCFGLSCAIVAMPETGPERLREILERYAYRFPNCLVIPNVSGAAMLWVTARDFGGILGLEISQNLLRPLPRFAKRVMDRTAALLSGVLLLPLLAMLAILVRLTSSGPAFYAQPRIGQDRRAFRAFKFRTMIVNGEELLQRHLERFPECRQEWRVTRKLRNDPRLTPIGRMLRRTSLDELPQLWNVIRGEMAFTGPRPIAADELTRYGDSMELYARVLPGITGLWQVSGRNDTSYEERVRLDEYYVRNWSVWLDLWILGRTVRAVITGKGAY